MSLRFLVVEDDPASREFARINLSPFGIVDVARTLADAGALCAEHHYGLLLLDVALPDGQGDAWLARQRALGNRTPAVALTAELDVERRRRLMASGFAEALGKPLSASMLRDALAPWLGNASEAWDNARALSALGGSDAALRRMRTLFLEELPRQRERVVAALTGDDVAGLRAVLHQLRAGCGFVGATALAGAAEALHAEPADGEAAKRLLRRIDETLASPRV
ncbi:response regulator [Silanimonas algicola]